MWIAWKIYFKKKVIRTEKYYHLNDYLKNNYIKKYYIYNKQDLILDFFMHYFRLNQPISKTLFKEKTKVNLKNIKPYINLAIKKKYIKENKKYWKVTKNGRFYFDDLIEIFMNVLFFICIN